MSSGDVSIRTELRPGDAGEIVRLHAVHYAAEHGLGRQFEADLAHRLGDALDRGWPAEGEGVWIAEAPGGAIGGVIALTRDSQATGHVRWFLVDPALRGRGVGRLLLEALLARAREAGYELLALHTFSALTAAAQLYRSAGFRCVSSEQRQLWGRTIELQQYELRLGDPA